VPIALGLLLGGRRVDFDRLSYRAIVSELDHTSETGSVKDFLHVVRTVADLEASGKIKPLHTAGVVVFRSPNLVGQEA
jgi:hypothetical protein